MLNLKAAGIAGAVGFLLSLLVGLVAGVHPGVLLMRAGAFGVGFFGLAIGIQFLITSYVPEALEPPSADAVGSRLNISVGDDDSEAPSATAGAALPGNPAPIPKMYQDIAEGGDEVGNINDIMGSRAAGMDQKPKEQYTDQQGEEKSGAPPKPEEIWEDASPVELADLDGEAVGFGQKSSPDAAVDIPPVTDGSVDVLPDLDSLAGSFSSSQEGPPSGGSDAGAAFTQKKKKDSGMKGDFNPKDMAEGLRTLLKKEQS